MSLKDLGLGLIDLELRLIDLELGLITDLELSLIVINNAWLDLSVTLKCPDLWVFCCGHYYFLYIMFHLELFICFNKIMSH